MSTLLQRAGCLLVVAGLAAAGCRSAPTPPETGGHLPFIVRINDVRLPPQDAVAEGGGEAGEPRGKGDTRIPPLFDDPETLKARFAAALEASGAFTCVLTAQEEDITPDLEMDIAIEGDDFGPGTPTVGGSISSTIAWLFGGHLSWFIDNRQYSSSNVMLYVTIRSSKERGPISEESTELQIFNDDLLLRGLQLNFMERADASDWFVNILMPPWWSDGDPKLTGGSLAARVSDFFSAQEVNRIVSRFPGEYYDAFSSYLVLDVARGNAIVMAQDTVRKVDITSRAGRRSLAVEEVDSAELRGAARDEIKGALSRRDIGFGIGSPGTQSLDRFYSIALKEDERGYIRIRAQVGRHTPCWTVYRPRGPDTADPKDAGVGEKADAGRPDVATSRS